MTSDSPVENAGPSHCRQMRSPVASIGALLCLALATVWLRADQVEMQNGDRYLGKVLSLTTDTLVIQSDVLGKVSLPRGKVALITLGTSTTTNLVRVASPTSDKANVPAAALTNTNTDVSSALRSLGANTNVIQQVRGQLLNGAGADANKKFDELLSGMANGSLDLNDIRTQARSAASQLRALKGELGQDSSEALDGYLNILDNFLKEISPAADSATSTVTRQPKSKPAPAREEE